MEESIKRWNSSNFGIIDKKLKSLEEELIVLDKIREDRDLDDMELASAKDVTVKYNK